MALSVLRNLAQGLTSFELIKNIKKEVDMGTIIHNKNKQKYLNYNSELISNKNLRTLCSQGYQY